MTDTSVSPRTVLVAAWWAQAAVAFVAFGLPAIGSRLRRAHDAVLSAFGGMGWNGVTMLAAGEIGVPALVGESVALVSTALAISSAVTTPVLGAIAAHAGWVTFWLLVALLGMTGALLASSLSGAVATGQALNRDQPCRRSSAGDPPHTSGPTKNAASRLGMPGKAIVVRRFA